MGALPHPWLTLPQWKRSGARYPEIQDSSVKTEGSKEESPAPELKAETPNYEQMIQKLQ